MILSSSVFPVLKTDSVLKRGDVHRGLSFAERDWLASGVIWATTKTRTPFMTLQAKAAAGHLP